jgi:general secretion pathway protein I
VSTPRPYARVRARGFTLVEVMIAIAILAMAMATVFGSNIGAARSTQRARMLTQATMMARCRVTEAEAYLQRNMLPEDTDKILEDPPDTNGGGEPCCTEGVTCTVHVEKIELPSPTDANASAAGSQILGRAAQAAQGTRFGGDGGVGGAAPAPPGGAAGPGGGAGALGGLGALTGMAGGGGSSGGRGGSGGSGASGPSPRDLASSLLSSVYPAVKPLLEGAIRRMTVRVRWREGDVERGFEVVEYVTNPGQTLSSGELPDPSAMPGTPGAPGAPGSRPGAPGAPGAAPMPGGMGIPGMAAPMMPRMGMP